MYRQREDGQRRTWGTASLLGIAAAVIVTLVLAVKALPVQARPAQEVAFTVSDSGDANDSTPGDGLCLTSTGTCTLRAAITESNAHGSGSFAITIPAMTINLTGARYDNANQGGDLDVTSAVTLAISGVPGSTIIDGQNNDRVLHLRNASASVTLDGLILQHGKTYDAQYGCGGGIYNEGSALVIQGGTQIRQNQVIASYAGGGGLCSFPGSRVTISGEGTRFEGNSSLAGGAIYNYDSDLTIEAGVQITQNTSATSGGGVFTVGDSSVTIKGASFLNNTALQGGAILNANGPKMLTIENSLFSGNTASGTDDGGYGGAISSDYRSELFITGSTLSDNTASKGGGAIYNGFQARLTLFDSTLTGNSGPQGGAIRSRAATVLLVDSTLAQNHASQGGAIFNFEGGQFLIITSDLANNTGDNGGAIHNDDLIGAVEVTQSCITGNSATAVSIPAGAVLTAKDNWWGAADGPSGVGPGSGDAISAGVEYDPFLTEPGPRCGGPLLPTVTPSYTPLPSSTVKPSATPTENVPQSDTPTNTPTLIPTDTLTPTATITSTPGITSTPTITPTPNRTLTLSPGCVPLYDAAGTILCTSP